MSLCHDGKPIGTSTSRHSRPAVVKSKMKQKISFCGLMISTALFQASIQQPPCFSVALRKHISLFPAPPLFATIITARFASSKTPKRKGLGSSTRESMWRRCLNRFLTLTVAHLFPSQSRQSTSIGGLNDLGAPADVVNWIHIPGAFARLFSGRARINQWSML